MPSMHYIRDLQGATGSRVQLVEINNTFWVRKKVDIQWVATEKAFYKTLEQHGIKTLRTIDHPDLGEDEMLLEYIPGETTLENSSDAAQYQQWGRLMAQIHTIRYDTPLGYNAVGDMEPTTWKSIMEKYVATTLARAERHDWYGFTKSTQHEVARSLQHVINHTPDYYSLIHGDPHCNNVLVSAHGLILFDKNDEMFSGSAYIDLAIVLINFPNGSFTTIKDPGYSGDHRKLAAFINGYGRNFIADEMLPYYVVLIAFRRMNSPHAKYNKEIILHTLKKL